MRILIASDQYPPSKGGVEKTTHNLVRALRDMGHTVAVVAPGDSLWKTYTVHEDNVPTLRVRSWPVPFVQNLRISRRPFPVMRDFLDSFQPDIIQVNNPYGLSEGIFAYANSKNIPVVAGNHTMPEAHIFAFSRFTPLFSMLKRNYWTWVARRFAQASVVVSPSRTASDGLVTAGIDAQRAHVISNGVDLSAARPGLSASQTRKTLDLPERFTLVHIGRLSIEKRIDHIIDAMALLPSDCNVGLVIVGDGSFMTALQRQAKRLGLSDRITFTGWVADPEKKFQYLAAAEAFVTASPMESQSIATLEAMAAGKPVIAADACALPELVHSGINGELYPNGDIVSLAKAIQKLARNPGLVERYGQASLEFIRQHDLNAMPAKYVELYSQLAPGNQS